MTIGLLESMPLLEARLNPAFLSSPYEAQCRREAARHGAHYDLVLCDKQILPETLPFTCDLLLVPGDAVFTPFLECQLLLTGGMNGEDAVSFSSIGEDSAMLCLQRELRFCGKDIFPFEKPIFFDRNFSLYKNLATGFALSLAELLFGEDV